MRLMHDAAIDALIQELTQSLQEGLGSKLLGVYLYGSLVAGDFDEQLSDLDMLAVVSSAITRAELHRLKSLHGRFVAAHGEWDDRVEVTYMPIAALTAVKTEPSEVVRISPGEPLHVTQANPHWLMDWYVVQECGVCVAGPPVRTFLPHISEQEFVHAARTNIVQWREWVHDGKTRGYQAYVVVTVCRNLNAVQTGRPTSKRRGAGWAARSYPQWSGLIECALQWRQERSHIEDEAAHGETVRFVEFAIEKQNVR